MLELGIARCTKTRGPGFPAPLACLLCRAHPIGHDSAGYDSEPLRRARRSPPWRRGLGDGSAQRDCGSETCATRVAVAEPPRGRQAQEAPAAEFPCDASTQSSPRGKEGTPQTEPATVGLSGSSPGQSFTGERQAPRCLGSPPFAELAAASPQLAPLGAGVGREDRYRRCGLDDERSTIRGRSVQCHVSTSRGRRRLARGLAPSFLLVCRAAAAGYLRRHGPGRSGQSSRSR